MSDEDAIRKYLSSIKTKIISEQERLGLTASGKTADSLTITSTESSGQLTGDPAFHFQKDGVGRKPGTLPNVKSIQQWIEIKGLLLSAWGVAVNLKKFGSAIYQGKRRGLTMQVYMEEYKAELMRDLAESLMGKALTIIGRFKAALKLVAIGLVIVSCKKQYIEPKPVQECYICHTQAANIWYDYKYTKVETVYVDKYEQVCSDIEAYIKLYTFYSPKRWVKTECYKKEK